jgi:hypothetical protein
MGQVLHGSATTTHAVRAAIQRTKASIQELTRLHGINPRTVQKWRRRSSVEDAPMGPKERRSTVLSPEEEALIIAFCKHTLLPLDDCLYALQAAEGPRHTARWLDGRGGIRVYSCRSSRNLCWARCFSSSSSASATMASAGATSRPCSSPWSVIRSVVA